MNKFTKSNLKPNMILRFSCNEKVYGTSFFDAYYVGSDIMPLGNSDGYFKGYLSLMYFNESMYDISNSIHLDSVFLPNPQNPFDSSQYEKVWDKEDDVNSLEFQYSCNGISESSDSVILFQPNDKKYYEDNFTELDRIMHITISNKIGNCSDISDIAITYNQMKDLRKNLDKIIKYIENKS